MPVPASSFNFSWRKSLKLAAPVTGPDNLLDNLRWFSFLQSLGTDREVFVDFPSVYTQGSFADESAAISAIKADDFTTGTPKVVNGGQVLGPAETGTGFQDFVVVQERIGPTAVAGNAQNAKQIVWRYDES